MLRALRRVRAPCARLAFVARPASRSLMVSTEATPNPDSLKFVPEKVPVLPSGSGSLDFADLRSANSSPLARLLLRQNGVKRVFLTPEYVTVTKDTDAEWEQMRPSVIGTLVEFYASGEPAVVEGAAVAGADTAPAEGDSEAVAMVKELLETRIRPAVQDDGGDLTFLGLHHGVVFLQMQGSCSGCPSSAVTLKGGIERMLMHWVPEVQGVMAVDSRNEYEAILRGDGVGAVEQAQAQSEQRRASDEALENLEKKLASSKSEGEL